MLEAEGFLERRPHRGVVVASRDDDDVADANRIRMLLESYAVREFARHPDSKIIADMEQQLKDAEAAMLAGDPALFRRASNGFHMGIIRGARSRSLTEIMNYMIPRSQNYGPVNSDWMPTRLAEHARILEAIRTGDGKLAADMLSRHHQTPAGEARLAQQVKRARSA